MTRSCRSGSTHTDTWLGHYAVLGAPVVRVFSGVPPKGMSEEQGIANGIKNLKKALVFAEKHGVILGLENHDYLMKIDRMLPALKADRLAVVRRQPRLGQRRRRPTSTRSCRRSCPTPSTCSSRSRPGR